MHSRKETMTDKTVGRVEASSLLGVTVRYIDTLRSQKALRWHHSGLKVCINLDDVLALKTKRAA